MRYLIRAGLALLLALTQNVGIVAAGQDDKEYPRADPEAATADGFPWVCFATSIAAIVGLYALVRRREQAIESDQMQGRRPATAWYCRTCARDVEGEDCPRCHAPNPFQHDTGRRLL